MFKSVKKTFGNYFSQMDKVKKTALAAILLTAIAAVAVVPLTKADNVVFNGPRDCNNNSILYCGAMSVGELQSKYYANGNAQQVYKYFGITATDINELGQTAKAGTVYKDGRVVVDGRVVATNSRSAGWDVFPGTTPVTYNGVTFHVSPNSASFVSDSISAYVVMDHGAFAYAILSSCGNPVVGEGGTMQYALDKTVRNAGGAWVKTTPVNYGEVYEYKVEVTNTGTGVVKWITTKDVLPADQREIPGSLTLNNQPLPENDLFVTGSFINRLGPGAKLTYIFKATTVPATEPNPCTEKQSSNVANTSALLLPNQTSNASVTMKCKPTPPPEKPNYTITKQVQAVGTDTWSKDVTVNSGSDVKYKVVATSTGTTPANNVIVSDKLPAGVVFKNGTLTRDGKPVAESDKFFSTGINIGSLAPGATTEFVFTATAGTADEQKCQAGVANNIATIQADSLKPLTDNANVTIKCKDVQKPDYKLTKQVQTIGSQTWDKDVTVTSGSEVRYRVDVTSTGTTPANNVIVSDKLPAGVVFKNGTLTRDGKPVAESDKFFSTGINIGSLAPGATTTFVFNATVGTAPSADTKCEPGLLKNTANVSADSLKPLTDSANVNKQCQPQKVTCDNLQAISLGNRSFQFKVNYTVTTGATFQTASYDFGDKSSVLVTDKTTVEHTYGADGTYTASVELTFLVNGKQEKVTSDACKTTIQASTPPSMCTIPGKQDLLASDPNCTTVVVPGTTVSHNTTPSFLPSTGPGELAGLFTGVSIMGAFAHRLWLTRRK